MDLSIALRKFGVMCNPSDPRLQELADQGVTADTMAAACEAAKVAKAGSNEALSLGYVVAIVKRWAAEAAQMRVAGAKAPVRGPANKAEAIEQNNRSAVDEAVRRMEARAAGANVGSYGPPDDPFTIDIEDLTYAPE
ncbi:hypothetical protein [Caballeronia zhejiangensis]|uniref:Uncharacterized protein n=1 Tax=Caballeronia zhejiangensis TaxID=871203 RepID=A0A656QEI8_9BURK|nr:hypothetical protein [Caballeronia zhejiangensis]KDR25981.1 hypothetical protein BG60_26250 [Caballeronia zhejiangensis]